MSSCWNSLGRSFPSCAKLPPEEIERAAGPCVAEGIRRLRAGRVQRRAGFDGEYGVISLLTPAEIEQLSGQTSLFGVRARCPGGRPRPRRRRAVRRQRPGPRRSPNQRSGRRQA